MVEVKGQNQSVPQIQSQQPTITEIPQQLVKNQRLFGVSKDTFLETLVYAVVIVMFIGFATSLIAVGAIIISQISSTQNSLLSQISQQDLKLDKICQRVGCR